MSIAEVVPRIIESIFSNVSNPFEELDITINVLENSRSFWSECYQITFNSEKANHHIVSPLFVKIPKISAINAALDPESFIENCEILRKLTAQEITFYKDFAHYQFPDFPIPRFYYGESLENEQRAGLVCEDFSSLAGSIDFVPGFSDDQVLNLMKALAGFHAKTVQMSGQIAWDKYDNALYDEEYIRMLYNDTLQFEEICQTRLSGKIQSVKHIFDENGVENSNTLNEKLGLPFVLCHNDLNASNILWNRITGDIQAFIDFQHVSKGAVTFDIIRILALGLSVEDRRDNTDRYLHHYYQCFQAHYSAPFSFEQLCDSFWAHFNFVNATSLFSLFYYYKMYKEERLDLKDDAVEREKKAEEILRRTVGILEDIRPK